MSKIVLPIITAVLCVVFAAGASAEGADYKSKGIGTYSCAEHIRIISIGEKNEGLKGWAYGFATAMNLSRSQSKEPVKSLRFLTGDLIDQEVMSYCRNHTDDGDVMKAIISVYNILPLSD